MATGAYDSNKVWIYGEDDSETTFSALLNKSASSVSTQLTSAPRKVADATARDALFPSPVQGNAVFRNDLGAVETYYGLYNSSTNPGGRDTAGWYVSNRASGIVPIKAGSIDLYGGGSATVSSIGEVVFTGASGLGLKNIFSSGYRNYRIVISGLKSATGAPQLHMRFLDSSGAIDSTSNYYFGGWIVFGTGSGYVNDVGANRFVATYGFAGDAYSSLQLEINNPYLTVKTQYKSQYSGWYSSAQNQNGFLGGFFDSTTQFTGVAFYSSTGTQITGEVTVYGYNK